MSTPAKKPKSPEEAYKAIIDQFVQDTRLRGGATHVREKGIFSKSPAHQRDNDFIRTLTPRQKDLLSDMIQR